MPHELQAVAQPLVSVEEDGARGGMRAVPHGPLVARERMPALEVQGPTLGELSPQEADQALEEPRLRVLGLHLLCPLELLHRLVEVAGHGEDAAEVAVELPGVLPPLRGRRHAPATAAALDCAGRSRRPPGYVVMPSLQCDHVPSPGFISADAHSVSRRLASARSVS